MTKKEFYTMLGLNMIFALRMVGVFMILPVLTIHFASLQGVNGSLLGIAIGIYGLMQVIFQLPFGLISDKIGHKSTIIGGLVLFIFGSEIAAITNNIWGLIIGRALQGSGAISSSLITLLLDSVKEEHRVKAMASMGVSVGIAFAAAMVFGPIITDRFGWNGLFHSITIMTILAIILTCIVTSSISSAHSVKNDENLFIILNNIKQIFIHTQLMKLNINIFFTHIILMLNFIVLPKIMINIGFPLRVHWKIYSIIMIVSAIMTLTCIFYFSDKDYTKKILIACMNVLFVSELVMFINTCHYKFFLFGMQLFFIAFSLIETMLPILINKEAKRKYKGTTMSIYSISQFLGTGFGGILGGFLLEIKGTWLVLFVALIISLLCVIIINTLY